jgi:hypothetical protein
VREGAGAGAAAGAAFGARRETTGAELAEESLSRCLWAQIIGGGVGAERLETRD